MMRTKLSTTWLNAESPFGHLAVVAEPEMGISGISGKCSSGVIFDTAAASPFDETHKAVMRSGRRNIFS